MPTPRRPPPVDDAGTALGGTLGTGSGTTGEEDTDPGDGPVTGAGVVDTSGATVQEGAGTGGSTGATEQEATEQEAAEQEATEDPAYGGATGGAATGGATATEQSAAAVPAADSDTTDVTLRERNGSGVSGTATIDADRVVATATGLDPDARYVSFFYGATSSATNDNPFILDGTNPLPSDQTIGEWEVDEDGNGTLSAANPLGARYALQAGTMSIRQVQHDFSTATALPVNPLSYSLVACGEVRRLELLDPVTDQVPALPKFPTVSPLS